MDGHSRRRIRTCRTRPARLGPGLRPGSRPEPRRRERRVRGRREPRRPAHRVRREREPVVEQSRQPGSTRRWTGCGSPMSRRGSSMKQLLPRLTPKAGCRPCRRWRWSRPPHMTRVQAECGGMQVPMVVIIVSRMRSSFVWIGPGLLQPAGAVPAGQPRRGRGSRPAGCRSAWIGDVGFCGCAASGGFEYACPL